MLTFSQALGVKQIYPSTSKQYQMYQVHNLFSKQFHKKPKEEQLLKVLLWHKILQLSCTIILGKCYKSGRPKFLKEKCSL